MKHRVEVIVVLVVIIIVVVMVVITICPVEFTSNCKLTRNITVKGY